MARQRVLGLCFLISFFAFSYAFHEFIDDPKILAELYDKSVLENIAQSVLDNQDAEINPQCADDLLDVLRLTIWGIRMIDAGGTIPHGILRGNLNSIGQYQGCIDISYEKPNWNGIGQHCTSLTTFRSSTRSNNFTNLILLSKFRERLIDFAMSPKEILESQGKIVGLQEDDDVLLVLSIGICLPSTCDAKVLNNYLNRSLSVSYSIDEITCTLKKTSFEPTPGDIAAITLLSVIGFIMLCSTLYDVWFRIISKGDPKEQKKIFVAFSVYTNSERLFTPSKNPGPVACIHGIRVLSILWIVLGHRYSVGPGSPIENFLDIFDWTGHISSSLILGSTVSVDTFFVLSGFLLSYVFFKSAKLENAAKDLPMFYIHRILRLTPLLTVMILITSTLAKHIIYGPLANGLASYFVEACSKEWWTNLLYVNNYVGELNCLGQAWYLAIDMQLFAISPILLYPLLWNKRVGLVWIILCIAIALSTAFAIAYVNNYAAGLFVNPELNFMGTYYAYTHTRATPYFLGILAGYLVLQMLKKRNIKTIHYNFLQQTPINQILIIIGWMCAFVLMGLVVLGYHPLNQKSIDDVSHGEDTLYVAFSRTAWSLGVIWVISACALGYGGPINWFLSLPAFEILARFTYAVFLNHLFIQTTLVINENHVRIFNHMQWGVDFLADVMLSYALAYVLVLMIESPVTSLEKIIFKRGKEKTEDMPKKEIEIIDQDIRIQTVQHPLNEIQTTSHAVDKTY